MIDSQIAKLESEIRYLKQLLDKNGISYDYQAYLARTQATVGEIQFPDLTPEHAIQFNSYFRGRKNYMLSGAAKEAIFPSARPGRRACAQEGTA